MNIRTSEAGSAYVDSFNTVSDRATLLCLYNLELANTCVCVHRYSLAGVPTLFTVECIGACKRAPKKVACSHDACDIDIRVQLCSCSCLVYT